MHRSLLEMGLRVGEFPPTFLIGMFTGLFTAVYGHKQSKSILKSFICYNLYKTYLKASR